VLLLLATMFALMLMIRRRGHPLYVVEAMDEDGADAMWDSLDKKEEEGATDDGGGGGGAATAAAVTALGAKIDQVGATLQQLSGISTNMEKVAGAVEGSGDKLDAISTNMEKVSGAVERVVGVIESRLDALVTHVGALSESTVKSHEKGNRAVEEAMKTPGMPTF